MESKAGPAHAPSKGSFVKGHSLLGASHHQHSGVTRNEPKPAAGGRATGPAVSRSPAANPPPPPLTLSHRAFRDKGAPARHLGRGGDSEKDSGRLRGGRNTAALPPGPRPRPPQQLGRRHDLLRRSSGHLGCQEAPTPRSSRTPGVHSRTANTRVWDGAQLGPPEIECVPGTFPRLDMTLRWGGEAAGGLRELWLPATPPSRGPRPLWPLLSRGSAAVIPA